ncbi:MAG: hypothetical protein K2X28_03740 [Alphaproteobacteria bacterium]|nr:hypothetical protein [Alphaproteobacteria bacterium]
MSLRSYLFTLCFLLGGCALPSDRVRCPKAAILAEFSKTIDRAEGVPIRTELDSLIPECAQDNAYTYMTFRLRTTSFRPISSKMPLTVQASYFVAVVDEGGVVLSRSDHDLEIAFASDQTTKVNFVQVQEKIPTQKKAAVYVGFNLDEAQFEQLQQERKTPFISPQ